METKKIDLRRIGLIGGIALLILGAILFTSNLFCLCIYRLIFSAVMIAIGIIFVIVSHRRTSLE